MASAVTRHYDDLLAEHYSWMVGMPFADNVAEQRDLLRTLGVGPGAGLAVDLGCGPGYQAVALRNWASRRWSPSTPARRCWTS